MNMISAGASEAQTLNVRHEMVGESPAMLELIRFIAKAAPTNSTVLIQGESGTGKELVARALHRNSLRREGPFVAVNCAALPEALLESELFGHEKGAFTGAQTQKKGKFELAVGGTLFLDEVGELSPSIQAKLLRALQEREIDRVGGRAPVATDVRFIAATNRELELAVAAGHFREDLYYRLNVVLVKTPPLRQRREDIPALARHFVAQYARQNGVAVRPISPAAETLLEKHRWPGNLRQLQNAIEHAMVLGSRDAILAENLPAYLLAGGPETHPSEPQTLEEALLRTKREYVESVLGLTGGNRKLTAAILGIHPKGMRRFLDRLNL